MHRPTMERYTALGCMYGTGNQLLLIILHTIYRIVKRKCEFCRISPVYK